ncbi:glycoside hydrolase family 2 protein [Gabonia massiliensis]|uniref:glycoside hydrolase family 2 protein n=1 Tax=Gabonia massiliensis TaxID=1686296 RepID=UPI0006D76FA5|nr:glycoside hydrolase family 2 TIM barrel-domain containing protein [Gabonia massiliensis]
MKRVCILLLGAFLFSLCEAKEIPLLSNIYGRSYISLNGKWNYIVDPLENGYYGYRLTPKKNGFFLNEKVKTSSSNLIEYNFDTAQSMDIPSDWNSKDESLFFYEGTVWFKRDFDTRKKAGMKYVLYFGAVNYDAKVYVNGRKVGEHEGGYTPFNFDVTKYLIDGHNFVVVKVDNKRHPEGVPTVNMDWWNYGGITRDVLLAEVPEIYIEDYQIHLAKDMSGYISGWVKLDTTLSLQNIEFEIPELRLKEFLRTDSSGKATFLLGAQPELWTPEKPKLYDIVIRYNKEVLKDEIGFRTITTKGRKIYLNGNPIFLRGVSIHEEAPFRQGRAWSREDAVTLLSWAKEMGCNYVRLAHYPHNEHMIRVAEKMGLMVWSEIPVYWTIQWGNKHTYENAKRQLHDMIYRDKNRCCVIIWSIANETPHGKDRDYFLSNLSKYARELDNSRLISMAMEVTKAVDNVNELKDNMHQYVDILSFNQYIGWYRGTNESCRDMKWKIPFEKPVIVSEFGGGALQGKYGDKTERWTEDYQEELYIQNLRMLDRIEGLSGLSPWILVDFRSPRRQLPGIQDFFNRKGLISSWGIKKKAYFVMQRYYKNKAGLY